MKYTHNYYCQIMVHEIYDDVQNQIPSRFNQLDFF
jgi:hypothetical protein